MDQFIKQLRAVATALAVQGYLAEDLAAAYFSRGYNTKVDADFDPFGLTAAELTNAITLLQQLGRFLGNQSVTTGAYQTTVDKLRTDI